MPPQACFSVISSFCAWLLRYGRVEGMIPLRRFTSILPVPTPEFKLITSQENRVHASKFTCFVALQLCSATLFCNSVQVTTILRVVASVFDVIIINRYNLKIGIGDHVMYMMGDNMIYQVAYMLVSRAHA